MIDLYTAPTPNGWKVAMALEEFELAYSVKTVDLAAGEQRTPALLAFTGARRRGEIFLAAP